MQWLEVSIYTTREGIDILCSRLMELGINGFEIEDNDDFLDFLENNKDYWDYVDEDLREKMAGETRVKIYVSDDEEGRGLLSLVKNDLASFKSLDKENRYGSLNVKLESLSEEDWENNWKQFFKPIKISDRLIIKPEWETVMDAENKIIFNIDPGMTFGSGQHETTRLCTQSLDKLVKKGMRVLDLGCGSGILSIISLMLGAKEALGLDIDPNCEKIALQNASLNGIGKDTYTVLSGNILTDENLKKQVDSFGKSDIVVANIVADVIIPLSAEVRRYMKEDGLFISSGIIEFRIDEVKEALINNGFEIVDVQRDNDWYLVISR